jgi:hypothetical protein
MKGENRRIPEQELVEKVIELSLERDQTKPAHFG